MPCVACCRLSIAAGRDAIGHALLPLTLVAPREVITASRIAPVQHVPSPECESLHSKQLHAASESDLTAVFSASRNV